MLSVRPAVMPQAQCPLWPMAIAGVPGRAAPATAQPGDWMRARYQCGGADGREMGVVGQDGSSGPRLFS